MRSHGWYLKSDVDEWFLHSWAFFADEKPIIDSIITSFEINTVLTKLKIIGYLPQLGTCLITFGN